MTLTTKNNTSPVINCTPSKDILRAKSLLAAHTPLKFNQGKILLTDLEADFDALVKLEKKNAISNHLPPIQKAALEQCKQAITSAIEADLSERSHSFKKAQAREFVLAQYATLIKEYDEQHKEQLSLTFTNNQDRLHAIEDETDALSARYKELTTYRKSIPFYTKGMHKLRNLFQRNTVDSLRYETGIKAEKTIRTKIQKLEQEKQLAQQAQIKALLANIEQLSDLYKKNNPSATDNTEKKSLYIRTKEKLSQLYNRLRGKTPTDYSAYAGVNALSNEELEQLSDYIQKIKNLQKYLQSQYDLAAKEEAQQSRATKFLIQMGFFFLLAVGLGVDGGASFLGTVAFFSLIPAIVETAVQILSAAFSAFNCVLFVAFEGSMLQDYFGLTLFGKAARDILNAQINEVSACTQINSILLDCPKFTASLTPEHQEHYIRMACKLNDNAQRIKDNLVVPVESKARRNSRYVITGFGAFMFATWAYYATFSALETAFALAPLSAANIATCAIVIFASLAYFAAMQARGVYLMMNPTVELSETLQDTEFSKKEKKDFDAVISHTPDQTAKTLASLEQATQKDSTLLEEKKLETEVSIPKDRFKLFSSIQKADDGITTNNTVIPRRRHSL